MFELLNELSKVNCLKFGKGVWSFEKRFAYLCMLEFARLNNRNCHFTSIQMVQPQPSPHHDSSTSSRQRLFDISNLFTGASILSSNPVRKLCTLLGHKRPECGSPIIVQSIYG